MLLWILLLHSLFRVQGFHFLWPAFPNSSAIARDRVCSPQPRSARTSVWALPISLAATFGIDVSFSSSAYLDVSVQRVPFHTLWIGVWMTGVCPAGFPHSEISGSMDICSSPKLIAAYHVFHRLLVPRHPPCALFCLTRRLRPRERSPSKAYSVTPPGFGSFNCSSVLRRLRRSTSDVLIPFPCFSAVESYLDIFFSMQFSRYMAVRERILSYQVGLSGLEPPTSRLSGVRSNRLSYKPAKP